MTKLVIIVIINIMKTMQAAQVKTHFSSLLKEVEAGNEIGIINDKKQETVAVIVPFEDWKKNKKRVLGTLQGKISVTFADDWYMTDEELLYDS